MNNELQIAQQKTEFQLRSKSERSTALNKIDWLKQLK